MKLFGKWRKEELPKDQEAFVSTPVNPDTIKLGGVKTTIGKGRRILVVDDNAVVVKTFEMKLKSYGFEVVTASEGSAAVSLARQSKPELIILDINFPPDVGSSGLQWDGFNIMQWLGRFQEVASIPIIIITSGEPEKFRPKAIAAGAADFFQKPIKFEEFLTAIDRIMTPKPASAGAV